MLIDTQNIPFASQVLEVCFESHEDKLCVCRAIAAIKDVDMTADDVALSFDFLLGHSKWREKGLSANNIQKWCEDNGRPFYVIFKDEGKWHMKQSHQENARGRSIAFAAVESHCYMYRDAHLVSRMVREGGLEEQFGSKAVYNLQCDVEPMIRATYERAEKKIPEVREWEEWSGAIRPGWFYASDLKAVRGELCRNGRNPKVSYSSYSESGYSQLTIACIEQLDGEKGNCCIREMTAEREKIQAWLDSIYKGCGGWERDFQISHSRCSNACVALRGAL